MDGKRAAPARRRSSAPRVVSPRNKVTIALPLSMIKAEEPLAMRAGDWISLAGLVISVVGFSVAIRELIRIAHSSPAAQLSNPANPDGGVPSSDGSSSPPAQAERSSR